MTVEQQIEDHGRWARKEGRKEGLKEAREKAAIKLLAMGMPNEQVAAALSLDLETVLKLKENS